MYTKRQLSLLKIERYTHYPFGQELIKQVEWIVDKNLGPEYLDLEDTIGYKLELIVRFYGLLFKISNFNEPRTKDLGISFVFDFNKQLKNEKAIGKKVSSLFFNENPKLKNNLLEIPKAYGGILVQTTCFIKEKGGIFNSNTKSKKAQLQNDDLSKIIYQEIIKNYIGSNDNLTVITGKIYSEYEHSPGFIFLNEGNLLRSFRNWSERIQKKKIKKISIEDAQLVNQYYLSRTSTEPRMRRSKKKLLLKTKNPT